jgi:hypothetical protein
MTGGARVSNLRGATRERRLKRRDGRDGGRARASTGSLVQCISDDCESSERRDVPRSSSRKASFTCCGWSPATRGTAAACRSCYGRPPERMGIVEASPDEQALLDAHGFGSGSVQ